MYCMYNHISCMTLELYFLKVYGLKECQIVINDVWVNYICSVSTLCLSLPIIDVSVCEDGTFTLLDNYTNTYGNVSVIGGTPLGCIFGQYSTLCDDNTIDPASADVLCAELGYYGQLVEVHFTLHCLCWRLFSIVN